MFFDHNSAPLGRIRSILGQVEATGLPELSNHHIPFKNSQEEEKIDFIELYNTIYFYILKSISFPYILLKRSCTPPFGLPADSENPYVFLT